MKLNLDFSLYKGTTRLKQWWRVVLEHFKTVQDAHNTHEASRGSGTVSGHVKLSDSYIINNGSTDDGIAVTPNCVLSAYNSAIRNSQSNAATLDAKLKTELEETIAAEAEERAAADEKLQANIDAEAEERSSDGVWEASERAAADEKLQSNIDAEATAREAADKKLQTNINTESAERAEEDKNLLAIMSHYINTDRAIYLSDYEIVSGYFYPPLDTYIIYKVINDTEYIIDKFQEAEEHWIALSCPIRPGETRFCICFKKDSGGVEPVYGDVYVLDDTAVKSAIKSEASKRAAADETLQANIDAEAAAREAADTDIISLIDGKSGVLYGVCTDAYDANYRTAEIPGFTLITGAAVAITFENGYEGTSASYLNINNTGKVEIHRGGGNAAGVNGWSEGETLLMIYDGTYWHIVGENMPDEPGWHSANTNGRAGYSTKDEMYFDGSTSFEDGEGVYVPTLETSDSSTHAASTEFVHKVVDTEAEAREAADTELRVSVNNIAENYVPIGVKCSDVNDLIKTGVYSVDGTETNIPAGEGAGSILVMPLSNELFPAHIQIYFPTVSQTEISAGEIVIPVTTDLPPDRFYIRAITENGDIFGEKDWIIFKSESFAEVCAALPDAAENLRGKVILLETTSGDRVYMCVKNASGEYEWKDISGGTDIVTQSETVATN